jgi:hypothetical protein
MFSTARKNNALLALTLCTLFIAAQFAVALHTFEHDSTAPQGKICSICVAATELGSAVVQFNIPQTLVPARTVYERVQIADFTAIRTLTVRQRGPPSPLSD